MSERNLLERELRAGGAGPDEARELARLAEKLPGLRQLPLVATPAAMAT